MVTAFVRPAGRMSGWWASLALLGMLIATAGARAGPYTSLTIFGDSLSDTGNVYLASAGIPPNFAVPPSPFYFAGRASNGPLWVDYLAQGLGLPTPVPSLAGGRNYAYSWAETGTGYAPPPPPPIAGLPLWPTLTNVIPNMREQAAAYIAGTPAAGPSDLFVVWGGPNDFFDGQTDPRVPVANLVAILEALAGHGGRNFLVGNLPPLELTPYGLSLPPAQQKGLRQLVLGFNALLAAATSDWARLHQVDLTLLDIFSIVAAGASDPERYGFSNVRDPALAALIANPGADVSGYLFWDNVHPTTRAHALIGAGALQQLNVPEPSSLLLFLGAALGLLGMRRRRAGVG